MASHHPPISGCRAQADGINWPQMQLQEAADFISEGLRTGECATQGRRESSILCSRRKKKEKRKIADGGRQNEGGSRGKEREKKKNARGKEHAA
ncbi:hypothetical protein NPIL_441071 [Nephila pilipes]|uniref:Uncharacterized protein n=1 Tax=Nephila pilipes TaxID=299642 RepID=A0A8X6P3N3_NEPPI|nr:hypothetical protein NPIL_441071 [Nephila pilipes]